jgi:hypothetical protein
MENKDALLIRKMITLVETTEDKIKEEETSEKTSEEIDEQVTKIVQTGAETLAKVLETEKGLFSTLRNEIPALSKFKNADELIVALKNGELATADSYKIIKQANKVPEIAMKLKGLIGESPTFKEIVKKVFPKGGAMPANPENFKLASETLQKTYGITAKEAETMLKKGATEMSSVGGVSTKAVDKAILKRGKDVKNLKAGSEEVKGLLKDPASASEAAGGVKNSAKEIKDPAIKSKFEEAGERIGKYGAEKWDKLKRLKGKLNFKSLVLYGLAGYGAYEVLTNLFGDSDGRAATAIPDCAMNLPDSEVTVTSTGDPVILYKGDVDDESKGHGGVKFYSNGRAWTTDNKMKGTYACKGSKLQVSEDDLPKGNGSSSPSNIVIKWDSSAVVKTDDDKKKNDDNDIKPIKDDKKKTEYKNCDGFPFTMGCKSSKIKELQKCLGLEPKYQTGNLGPKTKSALENWVKEKGKINDYLIVIKSPGGTSGTFNAGPVFGVREEVYNEIISKCKPTTVTPTVTTAPQTTIAPTPTQAPTQSSTSTQDTTPTSTLTDDVKYEISANVKRQKLLGVPTGRMVYKGRDLNSEEQGFLFKVMDNKGYKLFKDKDKGPDEKYVFTKK